MVNEKRLVRQFQKLVSIDAESWQEREIANYLVECLEDLGLEVTEDQGNLVYGSPAGNIHAYLPPTAGGKSLLLAGHMDTVSPGKGRKAFVHKNGKITSAGDTVLGADDHAALAEMLELVKVIQEDRVAHSGIEFSISFAEEAFCKGARAMDFSLIRSKRALVLDLAGPVGGVSLAAPTILSIYLDVIGRSAHAGFAPERGIHALAVAAEAIAQIPMGRVHEDTTVNLGRIHGGSTKNSVPDRVHIEGEIRSMSDRRAVKEVEKIRRTFQEAADRAGARIHMQTEREIRAYRMPEESELMTLYRKACASQGISPYIQETFGGSDNNVYAEHGIQGLVIASAMNEHHSKEEWTSAEDMAKVTRILLEMVKLSTNMEYEYAEL